MLFPEASDTDVFPHMHCFRFLVVYLGLQESEVELWPFSTFQATPLGVSVEVQEGVADTSVDEEGWGQTQWFILLQGCVGQDLRCTGEGWMLF